MLPGTYTITHIDLYADKTSRLGSYRLANPQELKLEAGKIYIFGQLELEKRAGQDMDLTLEIDIDLLKDACAAYPGIFERYPVVNVHSNREAKITCED